MRYKEGKKAMKSLIGGMSSFRMATFISVILVPIVSFMKPIMGVGSAITLLFQAYVCARIGMEYCQSNTDKSIAGVMAAVLAFKGSGWALLVGFVMNLLLSNMDFQKKKLGALTTEELDQVEAKRNEEVQRLLAQKNQE
jgi:Na+/melibiose symporter-like transporter